MTRVCLDSNVLVAAFVARGLCADLLKLVLTEHDLVIPEVVAEEVVGVLSTKLKVSHAALRSVEDVFARCKSFPRVDVPSPIPLRDPDDEVVLANAIAAGAEILVSGDQDLLVAAEQSPIRILSPRAFFAMAGSGGLSTRGPSP